jgi:site-specific DNA-methyltransferase (adenine-specific)
MKTLPSNSIDSVVTDPPYELGFMGKSWDNSGIANNPDMWREVLRVLKPGGHLLSFSGTRTYHRQAVAIEDAGFEVRDMVSWIYGSGFPKSLNIGKAVDKALGATREKIRIEGENFRNPKSVNGGEGVEGGDRPWLVKARELGYHEKDSDIPATEEAKQWEGWGTALKPAHEPICLARKPLAEKTVAQNVLKYGTGGINIDKSRVGTETLGGGTIPDLNQKDGEQGIYQGTKIGAARKEHPTYTGRFPANLLHDGSDEVVSEFPNESERFFKSFLYCPKASKAERDRGCEGMETKQTMGGGGMNNTEDDVCGKYGSIKAPGKNSHPTVKPLALMKYLIQMITPGGGVVLDPFAGSGSTLVAAKELGYNFIGIELTPEYIPIIQARLGGVEVEKIQRETPIIATAVDSTKKELPKISGLSSCCQAKIIKGFCEMCCDVVH